MNGIYVEEVYRRCIKQERDRDYQRRKTDQGAFEASFIPYDSARLNATGLSPAWLSDGGRGADHLIRSIDREVLARLAREKVARTDAKLLRVLDCVLENGNNRKESIWRLLTNSPASKKRGSGKPQRSATGGTSKNC